MQEKSTAKNDFFAVMLSVVEIITYLRVHSFIGLNSFLFGIKAFAGTGFAMLPMEWDIWVLLIPVIALGLYYSISEIRLSPQKNTESLSENSGLFTVSITAAGCFSYFVGRSYITNAFVITPYCLFICGLLTNKFAKEKFEKTFMKNTKEIIYKFQNFLKIFLCALFVVLIMFQTVYVFRKPIFLVMDKIIPTHQQQEIDLFKTFVSTDKDDCHIMKATEQVKDWSEEYNNGETPHLLVKYACFIEEKLGMPSTAVKCESIDCFYYENFRTYLDYIDAHRGECFIFDDDVMDNLKQCFPEKMKKFETEYILKDMVRYTYNNSKITYYIYLPIE